jgi:hypothetical protein
VSHLQEDEAGIKTTVLLAAVATEWFGACQEGVEFMSTIKTLAFAAVTALSLGAGAAMAQEGPNAAVSGAAYFGNQPAVIQGQTAQPGVVQSGSSDVEVQPYNNGHYFWTPGDDEHNAGSQG